MQSRWTNDLQLDQLPQSSVQISTNLFWTSFKRQPRDANSTHPIDSGMIHSIELNLGYLKLVLIIRKHDSLHGVQPPVRDVTKSVVKKLALFAFRCALQAGEANR